MTNRWFRVPEIGDGTFANPYRPKYSDRVDAYSGNKSHPDGSPIRIVRFYAPSDVLDGIAAESDAVELSEVPVDALNQMFGQDRDADGWERGFRVVTV